MGLEDYRLRLGTASDSTIAKEFNIPKHKVFRNRVEYSIPPYRKHLLTRKKIKLERAEFDELINKIGKAPDTHIATEFKISREYVRQLRLRHNVKKYLTSSNEIG